MERLYPLAVPIYETSEEREQLWAECAERDEPVVAIRDARRGFIVRYDLQHLDAELDESAVRRLRERTQGYRTYPTGTDPLSQAESVGGEAGAVSGDLHAHDEDEARVLASRLSGIVFDETNWQATQS
jgi:hypothetical protein